MTLEREHIFGSAVSSALLVMVELDLAFKFQGRRPEVGRWHTQRRGRNPVEKHPPPDPFGFFPGGPVNF